VNVTDRRVLYPATTLNKYEYGGSNPLKYIDPDGKDITIFYEPGLPGHTILLVYNQQTGQSGLRSFGPDHSQVGMARTAIGTPVPGTDRFGLQDVTSVDDLRKNYTSLTISTTPEEAQQVLSVLIEHPDGKYTTYWNNCTTTCAQILRDLGKFDSHPLTPIANFNALYYQYGNESAPANFWTGNSFKNGVDYGKYRPNYNPFVLLFRTINCTKYTWTTTDSSEKIVGHTAETVCK